MPSVGGRDPRLPRLGVVTVGGYMSLSEGTRSGATFHRVTLHRRGMVQPRCLVELLLRHRTVRRGVRADGHRTDGEAYRAGGTNMGLDMRPADRLALLVAAGVAAVRAQEAESRQIELDRRLQPMRDVIDVLERRHGPDVLPLDHPSELADLVARHGAAQLRERDVRLLQAATVERAERECARNEALDDLAAAHESSGGAGRPHDESSLLDWAGVSREQYLASVETALHCPPRG